MKYLENKYKNIVLVVIDGFGYSESKYANPLAVANLPNLKDFFSKYPHSLLDASEEHVGLRKGEPGSSEVGHMTIGAGYISEQPFSFVENRIKNGEFYKNPVILNAFEKAKKEHHKIHLIGQISDAGIHSHIKHFYPFLEIAKKLEIDNIFVHCITDGRDTPINSAPKYIGDMLDKMNEIGVGKIASVAGRYYSMDRTANYDRVIKSYDAIVSHVGNKFTDPIAYVRSQYEYLKNSEYPVSDEYITPAYAEDLPESKIEDGDVVIHVNLRADRAIEFSSLLSDVSLQEKYLPNSKKVNVHFLSLLFYADSVKGDVIYGRHNLTKMLPLWLEEHNLSQFRIAETEKFAHVTFFFDGENKFDGIEKPKLKNSLCTLIPSKKVPSFADYPQMSAHEITDEFIKEMNQNHFNFTLLNFANCDLVGHTANFNSCVKAVETVDECIGRIEKWCKENDTVLIITADHGNIEQTNKENGDPFPSHTLNLVPFAISLIDIKLKERGSLTNIAATICELFGYPKADYMDDGLIIYE